MKISQENIFPTTIRRFEFNNDEISPLLDEVFKNKKNIKKNSFFYSVNHYENYYTDFKKPTKLREYEMLMNLIANQFHSKGFNFVLGDYWTAIYGKNSAHNTHNHKSINYNFSSILYLTNGGSTSFISSNNTSGEKTYLEMAEVGKLIIFPSSLWHYVTYNESSERIIISSNIRILGNEIT